MVQRSGRLAFGVILLLPGLGCWGQKGGGELHARRVVLEREVLGLREIAGRLERGEPILPPRDVVIGISDATVQDMLAPQLPFEVEAGGFAVTLGEAELTFRGAPGITLRGTIHPADHSDLEGEVRAIGTLDDIDVDPASGTLRAKVVIDHLDLVRMAGLERFVTTGTTDELARSLRHAFEGRIPEIQIPVKIEQAVGFPSMTDGPVRLQGASMPLQVGVSNVFAGRGILWIGVRVEPGELVKAGPPPPDPEFAPKESQAALADSDADDSVENAGKSPTPPGGDR